MSSKNVQTHRDAHQAFNRHDIDEAVRALRADAPYVDHGRGVTMKGPREFADWCQAWVDGFSDARVDNPRYIDGGDHTVTNDGSVGTLPATGRRMDLPFCEVMEYDHEGHIVAGEVFYDTTTMMVQLGHMQPPPMG
jgi:ketosteroid isomerase-like protein